MKTLTTIKTTTMSGQPVDYKICESLNKIIVEVWTNKKMVAASVPEVSGQTVQGHYVYGQIGKVYCTNQDTWNSIWAAYNDAKATLEESAEYKVKQLREERGRLAREVGYAHSELSEVHNRAVESMMQGRHSKYDEAKLEKAIEKAQAKLDDFDAKHPEIVAQINADREASIQRNMWN